MEYGKAQSKESTLISIDKWSDSHVLRSQREAIFREQHMLSMEVPSSTYPVKVSEVAGEVKTIA